jgi:hypothetical protein
VEARKVYNKESYAGAEIQKEQEIAARILWCEGGRKKD